MLNEKTQLKLDSFLRTRKDFAFHVFTHVIETFYNKVYFAYLIVLFKIRQFEHLDRISNEANSKTRTYIRDLKRDLMISLESRIFS